MPNVDGTDWMRAIARRDVPLEDTASEQTSSRCRLLGLKGGMTSISIIERAFELARSGQCRSVSEVIRHLPAQDRPAIEAHLAQPAARRELILICSDAWLAAD